MLPVVFLVIFNTIFGNESIEELGDQTRAPTTCRRSSPWRSSRRPLQSLAIRLTVDRENGILKRGRGTPLPTWVFFAGKVGNAIVISVLMLVVVSAIGCRLLRRRRSPGTGCPRCSSTLAVGAAAFCCLGVALTAAIPSEDAAAPIANVALLPLYFLSGVFIPETEIPEGVLQVADLFPIRHFFEAFFAAYDPATDRRRLRVGPSRGRRRLGGGRASCSRSASSAGRRAGARFGAAAG